MIQNERKEKKSLPLRSQKQELRFHVFAHFQKIAIVQHFIDVFL